MMYLTQAILDHAMAIRIGLRDAYDWHRFVWKAFPDRDGESRDFLTRLDRHGREGLLRLLIVSSRPPERPEGWPGDGSAWQTRAIPPSFLTHRAYRFQLRANPTRRDNRTRKRVPLRTDGELRSWLDRKAEQGGFAVEPATLRIIQEGREWFAKAGHRGCHHAVAFQGSLAVTDTKRFAVAFAQGIGSAKAFGFGMLALVPVANTVASEKTLLGCQAERDTVSHSWPAREGEEGRGAG